MIELLLFRDAFSTEEMREVFSEERLLLRYMEVEAALARAQASLGIVPADAAEKITGSICIEQVDLEELRRETALVGYPILPLVHQWSAKLGDAGGFLHWGATTQDIMDTGAVLQVRDGLDIVGGDIDRLRQALAKLARVHRSTPMAGRTHLQHALPITFGYKAAVWLAAFDRHAERLNELRPRVLVAELAGASGTLASLGSQGMAVHRAFAAELGLHPAPIAWHVARDGMAEAVQFLGLVTGTLAKMALDISIMTATEFGEVSEPFVPGRGASSTMPQKRNPIACEVMLAAAKTVRQQSGLMLDALVQDFERATGPWHLEWLAVPCSFIQSAAALSHACFMIEGLTVDEKRMRANLDLSGGLIMAEAVMMGLAPHLGRQRAHDIVYDACRSAIETHVPLIEVLAEDPTIAGKFSRADLASMLDPLNYLGSSDAMIESVVAGRGV